MEFIDVRIEVIEAPVPLWRLVRVPADLPFSDMMSVTARCLGLYGDPDGDRRVLRNGEPVTPQGALETDPYPFQQIAVVEVLPATSDEVVVEEESGGLWRTSMRAVAFRRRKHRPAKLVQVLDGEGATPPSTRAAHMGHYVDLLRAREDRHHPDHRWVWRVLPEDFHPGRHDLAASQEAVAALRIRARLDGPQPREIRSLIMDYGERHPTVPVQVCGEAIGLALAYRAAWPDRVADIPRASLLAAAATWVVAVHHSLWGNAPPETDLEVLTSFWQCDPSSVVPIADDLIGACSRRGSRPVLSIVPRDDLEWDDDEDEDEYDHHDDSGLADEIDAFALLERVFGDGLRGPGRTPGP